MAESLDVQASFEHAQALANAKELAEAFRELSQQVNAASAAFQAAQTAGGSFGQAAQQAGANLTQFNAQVNNTTNSTRNYTQNVIDASQTTNNLTQNTVNASQQIRNYTTNITDASRQTLNLSNTTNNAVTNINNITNATRQAGTATRSLTGQVTTWIGSYIGLRGIIQLIDELLERMQKVIDKQRELAGEKLSDSAQLTGVMANLGLEGSSGEFAARRLRNAVATKAGSTLQNAGEALKIANASGMNPQTAEGMQYAVVLDQLMERRQLDAEATLAYARRAAQQGITTSTGLKQLIAKDDARFGVSLSTDPAAFYRGLTASAGPEIAKGVPDDQVSAVYSAMVALTRNEFKASQGTRQVFDLMASPQKKAQAYFAHRAAEMGVTQPGAVGDQDVEAVITTSKDTDERRIIDERKRILEEKKKLDDEEGHAARRRQEWRRRHFSPEQIADEEAKLADQSMKRRHTLEKEEADVSRRFESVRGREVSRHELEAYDKLGLGQKVSDVGLPTVLGLTTDEARAKFMRETGGQMSREDAMFLLSTPAGQSAYARATAAAKGRTAADTDRASAAHQERDVSRMARIKAQQQILDQDTTDRGMMYANEMGVQIEKEWRRDVANEKYVPDFDASHFAGDVFNTDSRQMATKGEEVLMREMNAFLQQGMQEGRQADPEFQRIVELYQHVTDDATNNFKRISPTSTNARIQSYARDFGNMKSAFEQSKKVELDRAMSLRRQGAGPATRPSTQPTGPVSSVIHNHNYNVYNHSVGQEFSGSGDGPNDLPGPLEVLDF